MDFIKFKKNILCANNLPLINLAQKKSTPFYLYSADQIKKNIKIFKSQLKSSKPLICFAVKSNSNLQILKQICQLGLGADVVSLGELKLALKAGFKVNKIVFSGVGKTNNELEFAIKKNILSINAESKNEIININTIAKVLNKKVNIGIRINPNIKAKTNKKITTGDKINKFGISINDLYDIFRNKHKLSNINIHLLSVHIGSQIKDIQPYKKVLNTISKILNTLRKDKHQIKFIDLGGGMGIPYFKNDTKFKISEFAREVKKFHNKHKVNIIFEIGRYLIGDTGVIISKVTYLKEAGDRYFVILDTGMNDMARSAIYEAFHEILPIIKRSKKFSKKIEFVGPICESSDTFGVYTKYSKLEEGDYICLTNCGAYGRTLSSNYNMRPLIEEVMINKNKLKTVRKRQSLNEII